MTVFRWVIASLIFFGALIALFGRQGAAQADAVGDGVEVAHVETCLAQNGRIDTNIVNPGPEAATYRIEFEGLSARENVVAAGDWWRMPMTGRPDGDYDMRVTRREGGEPASTVSDTTLQVRCDTNPPQLDEPEIQIVNACRAGNGYILFQFANERATQAGYVITFEGVPNRSTSAAPYGGSIRAVTGRPDGAYLANVWTNGELAMSTSVTVACDAPSGDPDPIPAARRVDWSDVGIPGGIPNVAVGAVVTDFGAVPNDGADDAAAFQAAIDAVEGSTNNAVSIPAGTWHIGSKLLISDRAVLRGAGSDNTRLEFTGNDVGIEAITYQRGDWVDLSSNVSKGASTIPVADASAFEVGGFFEIEQENDRELMYTEDRWEQSWSTQSVGQIGVVTAINGNTLTLREPLNIGFSTSLDARVRTQGLVTYVGIEDLRLDRTDNPGDGDGEFTVHWKNAAYTWMSGVESAYTQRYHVATESVYRCEVRDSYIHHAHDYGGGGAAYGVNLGRHATGCLVENNIFHTLRHSMLVQVGANGNVLGYNYSFDSRNQDEAVLPDIALHGHYPFANLFEANIVEEIGFGDWWGPAGPHNTALRNCVTREGLWYRDASHSQNIVGNELTDAPGNYMGPRDGSTAIDLIIHGNYFANEGRIDWNPQISTRVIPTSYYLDAKPAFYGSTPWPSTGGDLGPSCTNPARTRFKTEGAGGELRAACSVVPGGTTETADFRAMRATGGAVEALNETQVDGEQTFVRTVFDPPTSRMRWGQSGVELGVDVSDADATDYQYRAELRETLIDQQIPAGTTQAYCMRFDVLELPDLFGPVTIFQRFNRDNDGPDISIELTGDNQFSDAVPNDLQVVAFGARNRIGDMLDDSNTVLVVVYNHRTQGAYKVVLNGRVLHERTGIDTVGSPAGGWVQFGLYPHGFYGDDRAVQSKADQIASGQSGIRVEYLDFALTDYPAGVANLSAFTVD